MAFNRVFIEISRRVCSSFPSCLLRRGEIHTFASFSTWLNVTFIVQKVPSKLLQKKITLLFNWWRNIRLFSVNQRETAYVIKTLWRLLRRQWIDIMEEKLFQWIMKEEKKTRKIVRVGGKKYKWWWCWTNAKERYMERRRRRSYFSTIKFSCETVFFELVSFLCNYSFCSWWETHDTEW